MVQVNFDKISSRELFQRDQFWTDLFQYLFLKLIQRAKHRNVHDENKIVFLQKQIKLIYY